MSDHRDDVDVDGIGTRIQRYRHEAELSLSALAVKADVSKSYLHRLEADTGATRPSGKTLYALAEALGVTMSDLLGRKLLSDPPAQPPPALLEFATDEGLPESDVRMLASIEFRGEAPQTKERWQYIYNAIAMSRGMDRRRSR